MGIIEENGRLNDREGYGSIYLTDTGFEVRTGLNQLKILSDRVLFYIGGFLRILLQNATLSCSISQ
jgi:hypothetical protein